MSRSVGLLDTPRVLLSMIWIMLGVLEGAVGLGRPPGKRGGKGGVRVSSS